MNCHSKVYIFVAKRSAELFSHNSLTNTLVNYYYDSIRLLERGEDIEKFWHIVLNSVRSIVFYEHLGKICPIYDFAYDEAIKISRLTYNFLINFDIHGVIDRLIYLAQSPAKQQMCEEKHISKKWTTC